MRHERLVTPNKVAGRQRTRSFYEGMEAYLEGCAAFGRGYGLFSGAPGTGTVLPYLNPPDVVRMPRIQAIGVNGFHLIAGREETEELIAPLDSSGLAEGIHKVFACLAWDKTPCGEVFEDPAPDRGAPIRDLESQRNRIVLAVDDQRLEFRDWLQVGVLEVRRPGGTRNVVLDRRFHPAILDMRSYSLPNPLLRLSRTLLDQLKSPDVARPTEPPHSFYAAMLEMEAQILHNIAAWAMPIVAFAHAQRCLELARRMEPAPITLDGRLQGYTFDPETFCAFLGELGAILDDDPDEKLFPDLLEIDGFRCLRLQGGLEETPTGWLWTPHRPKFAANGLVLYLPRATPGTLPVLNYSQSDGNGRFGVVQTRRPRRGTALFLERLECPVERICLTVGAQVDRHRMKQFLGDGHAIYSY